MPATEFSVRSNEKTPLSFFSTKAFFSVVFHTGLCYNYLLSVEVGDVLNTHNVSSLLLEWYSAHYRPLPWRNDPSPYHVWVSEIMLQQTRIEAVLPYYRRFIETLPTIADLAQAPTDTLLKLWEGLGYYSRVRNMQKAAQILVDRYHNELPADYDLLLSLPGIGEYTAGAIASIAYDISVPAVDGNVMRVLSRLTADDTNVLSTEGKKKFSSLAWELIPEQNAGRFNQALMELGETVCLPNGQSKCTQCPLRSECAACRLGCAQELPIRVKKTVRRVEVRRVALIRIEGHPPSVLLHKRSDNGLLAGLWELPNTLAEDPLASIPEFLAAHCVPGAALPASKHLFSHIEWHMTGTIYSLPTEVNLPADFAAVSLSQLKSAFPLPGAFRAYASLLPELLNEEC